jgi:hypothetical protein
MASGQRNSAIERGGKAELRTRLRGEEGRANTKLVEEKIPKNNPLRGGGTTSEPAHRATAFHMTSQNVLPATHFLCMRTNTCKDSSRKFHFVS